MKKIVIRRSVVLCLLIVVITSMPWISFAKTKETVGNNLENVNNIANSVEIASENAKVINQYKEKGEKYALTEDSVDFEIPRDSDECITTVVDNGSKIKMSLPQELSLEDGMLASNGSIVYGNSDGASVCTQTIEENIRGEKALFNRTSVIIPNAEASNRYTFKFNLPNNYKLCKAKEYNKAQLKYYKENKEELLQSGLTEREYVILISELSADSNEIYIVDDDNEVVAVIGEAWAKDANGKEVKTSYEINGSSLTQVVEFNKNSTFPIVADPSTHPTYYKYFSLKKKSVKTLRDKYASSTRSTVVGYIASVALTSFPIASIGLASVTYASTLYAVQKHALWTKVYDGFSGKKNMVKIRVSYVWNDLHKAYAPSRNVKVYSYYKK